MQIWAAMAIHAKEKDKVEALRKEEKHLIPCMLRNGGSIRRSISAIGEDFSDTVKLGILYIKVRANYNKNDKNYDTVKN